MNNADSKLEFKKTNCDVNRMELAIADIKQAEEILSLIAETTNRRIRDNLWEYFVVVYCRPFTTSNIHGKESKMLLYGLCPKSYTDTLNHKTLMECRMNITAHTSYDYSNVKILDILEINGQPDVLVARDKIIHMREVCKLPLKEMLRDLENILENNKIKILKDAISKGILRGPARPI